MKRKRVRIVYIWCLSVCLLIHCLGWNQQASANAVDGDTTFNANEFTLNSLSATDAVDRTLPRISGYAEDKYVGLFYFLWHGQHTADKPRNITELLKTNYQDLFDASPDNTVVPYNSWLHYQEPLYGYYNSMDEWVMRKHIEMFIAADVDFLVIDFTNGVSYNAPLRLLMDLLLEYKAAGWNVPQLTFYINVDAQRLTNLVYKMVYTNDQYKELAFYGNGSKPIIVSVPHLISDTLNDFFDVRASQWYRSQYPESTFPYWEFTRKWNIYTDMVNISVAQTGTAFSYVFESWNGQVHTAWGRGYSSDNPKNGDVDAILQGANFQEGWDAAIQSDPDIIFITGWNEWVVQKRNLHEHMPELCPYDFPDYTDNFNVEFSRDLEMTKAPTYVIGEDGTYLEEGYGDNYYLQLVYNIRRYKGISTSESNSPETTSISIDLDGSLSQWNDVQEKYVTLSAAKVSRDCDGFYQNTHYTQDAPDNYIKEVQVTYDDENVYFRIETQEDITDYEEGTTNWMNLFIGINGLDEAQWESFHYVINRNPVSETVTSLERFVENDEYYTETVGEIQYRVNGCHMQIEIPRSLLGIGNGEFSLNFKVADGIEEEENILDYYVSGESFPLGRMTYLYETAKDGQSGDLDHEGLHQPLLIAIIILAVAVLVGGGVFIGIILIGRKKK